MATRLPFENIKAIPDNHKDIVFGYLRKCQSDFESNATYYQIHQSIQYTILLFYFCSIDSKILTTEETDQLISLFAEQNKFKHLEPYQYDLLFASYKDGMTENVFKEKCHDKENVICLIETKAGNVWGGYTSKGWRGRPPYEYGYVSQIALVEVQIKQAMGIMNIKPFLRIIILLEKSNLQLCFLMIHL